GEAGSKPPQQLAGVGIGFDVYVIRVFTLTQSFERLDDKPIPPIVRQNFSVVVCLEAQAPYPQRGIFLHGPERFAVGPFFQDEISKRFPRQLLDCFGHRLSPSYYFPLGYAGTTIIAWCQYVVNVLRLLATAELVRGFGP